MSNQSLINDNNNNKSDEINNTFNSNESNICENDLNENSSLSHCDMDSSVVKVTKISDIYEKL
jgi:hypothetical protein